jgi:hypothetical protein
VRRLLHSLRHEMTHASSLTRHTDLRVTVMWQMVSVLSQREVSASQLQQWRQSCRRVLRQVVSTQSWSSCR